MLEYLFKKKNFCHIPTVLPFQRKNSKPDFLHVAAACVARGETWCFAIGLIIRLRVAQLAMQRGMLGVSPRGRISSEGIRRRIQITDGRTN